MLPLAINLVTIAGLILLGYFIIRFTVPQMGRYITLGISFPLGAGVFSWSLFLLSWSDIPLTPISMLLSYLALLATSLVAFRRVNRNSQIAPRMEERNSVTIANDRWKWPLILIGCLVFATSVILAVGRSYSSWDAMAIWAAKGYGISHEQTIFGAEIWGAHGLEYPLNIPLLISSFRIIEGDLLPGSKLIFPLFYGAALVGGLYFWRTFGVNSRLCLLGLIFISTIPTVFDHATIGYANLPFSAYLVLGASLGIIGIHRASVGMQILSGCYLGLAAWTRPEGVFLIPIVIITLLAVMRISRLGKIYLLALVAPVALIMIPWAAFGSIYSEGKIVTGAVRSMGESFARAEFNLEAIYWTTRYLGRQLVETSAWGLLLPLAITLLILDHKKLNPRRYPIPFASLVLALTAAVSILGFYYLVSFQGDLRYWLETGVNRMFLPAILLGMIWLILSAGIPSADEAKAG